MTANSRLAVVAQLVTDAEQYRSELSKHRNTAQTFYDGGTDVEAIDGRSKAVSNDIRAAVHTVLPSLIRTILGSDDVVEFQPVGREDEDVAQQASDYINDVVFPESNGHNAVHDALHDALRLRNGVLMWWWENKTEVVVSSHTGLDEISFSSLVAEKSVEVLEHTERVEVVQEQPVALHDVKIKRIKENGRVRVAAVPPEEFLIADDAVDEDSASLIGRVQQMRLTDLVALGYDRKKVMSLTRTANDGDEDGEKTYRKRSATNSAESDELEQVDYYEVFVRIDMDNDGIAELHRMCFAGSIDEKGLLDDEPWDEVDYAIGAIKRRPHTWEGTSLADDLIDIARQKTVLTRQTLDNLYQQNLPQKWAQEGTIVNADAIASTKFGKVVWLERGVNAAEATGYYTTPFTADKSFAMLEYLDREKQQRTGVSEHAGGLPPDALQNMTATASAMVEQMGIGQVELMARTFAQSLKRMFKGLLKLTIKHQDKARTVRLRGQWVDVDPRSWNASMDCSVNTGLGAGTRERDMMAMSQVLQIQERIISTMGPKNPFVTGAQLANTLNRYAISAGLRNPRLYFNKPTEDETKAFVEEVSQRPSPEQVKAEAEMQMQTQLKQLDIAAQERLAQIKADVDKHKEMVQSQAAVEERQAISVIEEQGKDKDRELEVYKTNLLAAIELLKIDHQKDSLAKDDENRKADRAATLAEKDLVEGGDGKPASATQELVKQLMEVMSRPKTSRVRTPDGEEFVMESA